MGGRRGGLEMFRCLVFVIHTQVSQMLLKKNHMKHEKARGGQMSEGSLLILSNQIGGWLDKR